MSSNQLKIIACISMLIDHIGLFLFPSVLILRNIGRVAMPIFAFFIAQGCRYTKNKKRYFLQVFLLGVFCQIIYIAIELYNGTFHEFCLNILITFSFSIIICYIFLEAQKAYKEKDNKRFITFGLLLAVAVAAPYLVFRFSYNIIGIQVSVDYGIRGIILPLFACIFTDKNKQIASFSVGLIGFMILTNKTITNILCSSVSIPLLYAYNGTYGSKKLKYLFYIFYPTHLAVLYLINLIIN